MEKRRKERKTRDGKKRDKHGKKIGTRKCFSQKNEKGRMKNKKKEI